MASITQQLPASISETDGPPDIMPFTDRATLVIPTTITGKVRGSFQLGPVALTIPGPWGLAKRSILYNPADTITVVPSIVGAGRYRLLAAQHRLRTVGHRVISREFTVEQGQTVMIAMDCGRMMTQLAGDRPRFEYALASALTLADIALSTGDRVGLIAFDSTVRSYLAPTRVPGTIAAIRDALTSVTATMTEPDYAAAFRTLTERNRRRSLIVLFTDVIDVRSSRAVIALSAHSSERHLPLVVALRNEQLVAASIPSTGSTDEQTYESAAAEELISARDEALQIMRQTGVAVIDTAPAAMTAALINRYLEIKERSVL